MLISISLLVISLTAVSLYFSQVNFQNQILANKILFSSQTANLQNVLSRTIDCDCVFVGKNFDGTNIITTTNTSTVDITTIKTSCAPGAVDYISVDPVSPAPVKATRIYLKDIANTNNSNEYTANLQVDNLDQARIRSYSVSMKFWTDPTSPITAKVINGCGPAPPTIPQNLVVTPGPPGSGICNAVWNPSAGPGPINYLVKYSTTPGASISGPSFCQTAATGCTSAILLTPGTTYYFSIQATNPWRATKFSTQGDDYNPPYAEATCTPN